MGVAECKHHHILKTARAILISSSVPRIFWVEAILSIVNLINITPSSVLAGRTPHERLYFSPPDYSMLHTFGCTFYVLLHPNERTKLSARSAKCVLLGISSENNGYRCYDPLTRHLLISRHVSFIKDFPYFSPSSQDIHFLSPPDAPSVEFSRFPIDLIPLTPSVSIPPTDHSGTIPTAIIPTPTPDHEDLPVTTMPPSPLTSTPSQPTSPPPPPLRRSERPHKPPTCLTPCCTGPLNQFNFASTISFSSQF